MIGISRRTLLRTTIVAAPFLLGLGATSAALRPKPLEQGVRVPEFDEAWPDGGVLGTETPLGFARRMAVEIENRAPKRTTPLQVARYFDGIGRGAIKGEDKNADGTDRFPQYRTIRDSVPPGEKWIELREYVKEWTKHYSPLVVKFFDGTGREPNGDCTPWCAAFVNWCMQRSREEHPNAEALKSGPAACLNSTASQDYRRWGRNIDDPRLGKIPPRDGDIVVFEDVARPGFGHVGFYRPMNANDLAVLKVTAKRPNLTMAEAERDYIKVLGGNQGGRFALYDTGSMTCKNAGGGVTVGHFSRGAKTNLRLHSIRTHESLHSV